MQKDILQYIPTVNSTQSKQEEERTVIATKISGNESNRITTTEYSNGDWEERIFCPVTGYSQITTYDAKTNKISRGRPFLWPF